MQQELAVQLKESRTLLEKKEQRLTELKRSLPEIEVQLRLADSRVAEAAVRVGTKRDDNLDAMLEKKGFLESQLQALHEQARALAVLQDQKSQKARLTSELQSLGISIKTRRRRQEARLTQGRDRIQKYALALLKRDLPREPYFAVAQSVTLNFAKDTFAVDGRNQFSASSMTYLKNAVHFSILFSSLDLEFFRYPRFLLCDNIEDKGMEEIRSQNFQRTVVEMSNEFDVEHQIIFTTSMIAPELDNSEFCVGPAYSLERHTLQFNSVMPQTQPLAS
jgi:hypothetical protein